MHFFHIFTTLAVIATSVSAATTTHPSVAAVIANASPEDAATIVASPDIIDAIVAAPFGSAPLGSPERETAVKKFQDNLEEAHQSKVPNALADPDPCRFSGTPCSIYLHDCCLGYCWEAVATPGRGSQTQKAQTALRAHAQIHPPD
ncbi:hypothetical protein BDV98DRAFT_584186 [Pterulicium gracile]|uniref:Uncharacterized protein n=1 Tax=Pterulicium gracile TaxID=1884261 RepID=A0A5C3QHA0_9AGAR|nr:hypothetical protein BDV98DRAFT_584186 [Pterula gracilis]